MWCQRKKNILNPVLTPSSSMLPWQARLWQRRRTAAPDRTPRPPARPWLWPKGEEKTTRVFGMEQTNSPDSGRQIIYFRMADSMKMLIKKSVRVFKNRLKITKIKRPCSCYLQAMWLLSSHSVSSGVTIHLPLHARNSKKQNPVFFSLKLKQNLIEFMFLLFSSKKSPV